MIFQRITPQMAQDMLSRNPKNRKVSSSEVNHYARDMQAGNWQVNGAAIVVDGKTGELLDGQHRLLACVKAGTPFQTFVFETSSEIRKTIDSGRKRTIADRLQMNGVKYANRIAAAINVLETIAENKASSTVTSIEADEFIANHPGIVDSAAFVDGIKHRTASTAAALHYIGHYIGNGAEADDFIKTLKTGIGYGVNDPAFVLRERLIRDASATVKIPRQTLLKTTIASFKRYLAGETSQVARAQSDYTFQGWTSDDMHREPKAKIAAE